MIKYILITASLSFFAGILFTKVFLNKLKVTIKFGETSQEHKKEITNKISPKYEKANILINHIRMYKSLPIKLQPVILQSLREIAHTKNWEEQIDDETLENLNKIYERWQRSLNVDNKIHKVGKAENMEEPNIWEGTYEEYKEALSKGLIKEGDIIRIIEQTGTWLGMDNEGQIEEWMN